ncbi:MAG: ATP-dependent zinc protease [Desulfobacterales bacterium]|nr:ATP-dependent zinc protease [Desulfobacterales bacterium]
MIFFIRKYSGAFLFACLAMLSTGPAGAASQAKQVAGWLERVMVCPEKLVFRAKLDTGAKTTSLDASNIATFQRDGENWLRFDVTDFHGKQRTLEKRLVRVAKVKQHQKKAAERFVIHLGICLGELYRQVEVNITDRSGFNYRMLIGRSFMGDRLVVDPSIRFTTQPACNSVCFSEP